MNKKAFAGLFLPIFCCALLFRVAALDRRPMHHDEANQAVKFRYLLEKGDYRYDRLDHHGPSLYYLTLPFAWIASHSSLASLDETTMRLVPAVFGIGLILLLLLLQDGLSRWSLIFAAVFIAISPVVVFYSRFYIQETLLLFFLLGLIVSGWRYFKSCKPGWAAAAGFSAGMMYATKETSLILFGAMGAALGLTWISEWKKESTQAYAGKIPLFHLGIFMGFFILVAVLLFSSFFQNLSGPLDSILSFQNYFVKAGDAGWHSHPWTYYLEMLTFSRYGQGPVWSEALIVVLAVLGAWAAFKPTTRGERSLFLGRFLVFFTLLTTAIYSAISYKTPWNLLPFFLGIILMAGIGAAYLIEAVRSRGLKGLTGLLLAVGILHLGVQCFRANFTYFADIRNPYVYAHTSPDFLRMVERIQDLSQLHPDGQCLLIKVVTGPYEAWPLPWYLRRFDRVGYWSEVEAAGDWDDVPLIITTLHFAGDLENRLQTSYQTEYYGLRPEVPLVLHIEPGLWDRFMQLRREP